MLYGADPFAKNFRNVLASSIVQARKSARRSSNPMERRYYQGQVDAWGAVYDHVVRLCDLYESACKALGMEGAQDGTQE